MKKADNLPILQKELELLNRLKNDYGLPTVEILGNKIITHNGKPAIVMKKYVEQSKDIKNLGGSFVFNQKSIDDLNTLRQNLIRNQIEIKDPQFLVGKDGSVVIADPENVLFNTKATTVIDEIDDLIKIAQDNVKK